MKKKTVKAPTVSILPIKRTSKNVSLILPEKFIKNLGDNVDCLFCTVVNGVLQVSVNQPHLTIPVLSVSAESFIPH